ncbi:hypothetical protein LI328DRAFT_87984 [Trichoderma asperelloides]|nr:hypothetical protein LI328DRAFT_87984 [Trichoderma asperelloides]
MIYFCFLLPQFLVSLAAELIQALFQVKIQRSCFNSKIPVTICKISELTAHLHLYIQRQQCSIRNYTRIFYSTPL